MSGSTETIHARLDHLATLGESMDLCERCGTTLHYVRNPLLRCGYCGWENDGRRYAFACGDETREECEWCEERMCRLQGEAVAGVA